MKRLGTVFGFATLAALGMSSVANAQDEPSDVTLILHGVAPSFSNCGAVDETGLDCDSIDATGASIDNSALFVFVIVGGVPDYSSGGEGTVGGIGGIQFGIEYDPSLQIVGNAVCTGGSEIPQDAGGSWPESGTGNAMTWSGGCLSTVENADSMVNAYLLIVVAATGEGTLRVTGDPRIDDQAAVTDCFPNSQISRICPQSWGTLNFSGDAGFNPCGLTCAVPVQDKSWTEIKSLF